MCGSAAVKTWYQSRNNSICRNVRSGFTSMSFPLSFVTKVFVSYLKACMYEEILNWHSLSLNDDLCIIFYWLSRLSQASHRKMIQSSALRQRLWLCQFKICKMFNSFQLILWQTLILPFHGLFHPDYCVFIISTVVMLSS